MKFLMGDNDGMPSVVVFADREDLIASFWGFGPEEAELWFKGEEVKHSLERWHSVFGDFELTVNSSFVKGDVK